MPMNIKTFTYKSNLKELKEIAIIIKIHFKKFKGIYKYFFEIK